MSDDVVSKLLDTLSDEQKTELIEKILNNRTPEAPLTERRRPKFKKVSQFCERCKTTFEVHPQFARDFFVCDKCLRR